MFATKEPYTGCFTGSFKAAPGLSGTPILNLILTFDHVSQQVKGSAEIIQSEDSPIPIKEDLSGVFNYMTGQAPKSNIIVKGSCTPKQTTPATARSNFEFYMLLENDWQLGTINYWFSNSVNNIDYLENIPVKTVGAVVE